MHLLRQLFVPVWMLFILFSCSTVRANEKKTVLCVFDTEKFVWPDESHFTAKDVDPNLCTHLVYYTGQINIDKREIVRSSKELEEGIGNENIIALKRRNPNLKVLISLELIFYEKFHPTEFIVRNNEVAKNVVLFLKQHKFDGIYLTFHPTEEVKIGFMEIINAMKKAFQPHGYILALISDQADKVQREDPAYDFDGLSRNLDFLILNAYNFYNYYNNFSWADHHAPLYSRPWDTNNDKTVDFVVNHWINEGFPPEKILLGIPLSGNTWNLSSEKTNPPAPAKGPGSPVKLSTYQHGFLGYLEICLGIKNEGWKVVHDPNKTMGPYAFSTKKVSDQKIWVGFDDPDMAVVKSEYIISKGLGGAAVTDISYDDFKNKCGGGRYPMLSTIRTTLTPGWTNWTTSSIIVTTVLNPYLFSLAVVLLFPFFPLKFF